MVDNRRISVDFGTTDEIIAAIAEAQRGQVARPQLLASGLRPSAIDRRIRNGRLIRVHPGVYSLPQTSAIPLSAEVAALLTCGEVAFLSHHNSAVLWRMRRGIARPVHVTIPAARHGPAPDGVIVHRSAILMPIDVRIHESLPVTSPARTLLDVSATLPDRDIERLYDEARFVLRILTGEDVDDILRRAGAHPGRARLARVRARSGPPALTDSDPEERLLMLLRAVGLPEPQLQAWVLDYRLDFFWPQYRLAVEVDAYGTHGSPVKFESDRLRDSRLLTEAKIVVLRLTRPRIERESYAVVAAIARAMADRGGEAPRLSGK
ncbi:MAG: type IV toxin-antitoxin system AbiEi family antitoxin domain-containing protein [Solirubrobacteraceae bacterium]